MASIQRLLLTALTAMALPAASIHAQGVPEQRTTAPSSGLVTLYALDPVTSFFSLTENHAGGILEHHRDLANGAEIDFGEYHAGNLTVADSNGMTGAIVDLGTAETHKKQDEDSDADYQELKEGSQLFGDLKPLATAPIILGHIYVLRVIGTTGRPVDFVAKLKVVAFQPDQAVTIRWEILPEE